MLASNEVCMSLPFCFSRRSWFEQYPPRARDPGSGGGGREGGVGGRGTGEIERGLKFRTIALTYSVLVANNY